MQSRKGGRSTYILPPRTDSVVSLYFLSAPLALEAKVD